MSATHTAHSSLWLPSSRKDLEALGPMNKIYTSKYTGVSVVQTAPDIVIKYGGRFIDFSEEILCMRFATLQCKSLPIPRILHHPSFDRRKIIRSTTLLHPASVWYICMEKVPGTSLDKVVDNMTASQIDHVATQLRAILHQLQAVKSAPLGSVSGGPYRNEFFPPAEAPKYAMANVSEFTDHYRHMLMFFCGEAYVEKLLARLPRNAPIRFTHGDLVPKNIMVDGSTITGIIDWATGGFYPGYWEYCRMHDPQFMTPGWKRVLQAVFPGEPRQDEIHAVYQLVHDVSNNM